MIHVLVLILKIIGWILLGVLGLILGILLFVLFSAVRYRIDGEKNGKPEGKIKISWLLWILSATIVYQDGLSVQAKLFGKTVWKTGGEKKTSTGSPALSAESFAGEDVLEGQKEAQESGQQGISEGVSISQEISEGEGIYFLESDEDADCGQPQDSDIGSGLSEDASEKDSPKTVGKRQKKIKIRKESDKETDEETDKKTDKEKNKLSAFVNRIKERILSIIRKVRFSIQSICGKLKQAEERIFWIKEKWERVQAYIQNPANRKSAKLILRQAKKILIHPLPRKGRMSVTFGVEDPYQMGQILSAAAFVYPFVHKHIRLHPVFGQKCLEGEIHIRGRIRLGVLLGHVLRLLLDGNIRRQLWNLIWPSKKPESKKMQKATAES